MRAGASHLLSLIYKFRFQDVSKPHKTSHLAFALTLFQSFPKGRLFSPSFVFGAFHTAQHGCFVPKLSREQLHVSTAFSVPSGSFPSSLRLQSGWLYCKLKNKQVLSGCTLFSSSLYLFPLSSCPFPPVPSTSFFSYHQLPFCSVSFISCSSPAVPVKPNPKPTHPLVTLPLVIKTIAILSLL